MCLFVGDNDERRLAMRIRTIVLAALALSTAGLAQTPASALPYDPYPWCAVYGGRFGGGASNCGFSTWNHAWQPSAASADFASATSSTTRARHPRARASDR